ncbi:MAG: T9SS type A sorting domain-containing protein [Chitinophagaceae bacterium]|nr:T9SS type A sorting domain-containing protein [Chitinophagaceae bacterium]
MVDNDINQSHHSGLYLITLKTKNETVTKKIAIRL